VQLVDGPSVGPPADTLARWTSLCAGRHVWFIGDGAVNYRHVLDARDPACHLVEPTPPLAPAVARMAARSSSQWGSDAAARRPAAYVRRPDAELSRSRHGTNA